MAAFQGKQYLDISMSRPQRKNASLVINPLKAEQAHVALRNKEKSYKDAVSEDSVYTWHCQWYVYKNLFASLYLSIFDPDTIQGEEWIGDGKTLFLFLISQWYFFILWFPLHSAFACHC